MSALSFPSLSGTSQQYVYGFTSEEGCVKVGRTVNVKARLGSHRSRRNAVTALFLLKRYCRETALAVERSVKQHLADRRVRGDEWFACSPVDLELAVHRAEAAVNARPAENLVYRPVPVNWAPGVCKSGNSEPVHVLVPAEMVAAIKQIAVAKKWSLAVTVREAIERLIEAEKPEPKGRKR